jgi:hypothetical protein
MFQGHVQSPRTSAYGECPRERPEENKQTAAGRHAKKGATHRGENRHERKLGFGESQEIQAPWPHEGDCLTDVKSFHHSFAAGVEKLF